MSEEEGEVSVNNQEEISVQTLRLKLQAELQLKLKENKMEGLKKVRTATRKNVTRYMNSLTTQFASLRPDKVEVEMTALRLTEDLERMKINERQIEEAREDEETEAEYEETQKYIDDATRWGVRVKNFLTTKQRTRPEVQEDEGEVNTETNTSSFVRVNKPRLPKLEIPVFGGDVSEWRRFWEQFEAAIDVNSSITETDKFIYLKTLLKDKALAAISGLQLTEANYESAKKILKDRFGNTQVIIQSHLSKLASIKGAGEGASPKKLRSVFDNCQKNVWSLEALGVDSSTYSVFLTPIILRLFPKELDILWMRSKSSEDSSNLNDLLDFLNKEIERLEQAQERRKDVNEAKEDEASESDDEESTASALWIKNGNGFCIFCEEKNHWAQDCKKVTNIQDRRNKLKKDNRCFICFRKGHRSSACPLKEKLACKICPKKTHHRCICTPRTERPKKETTQAMTMACRIKTEDVYLQTARAWIRGSGKRKMLIRVLLDTASHRTYITKDLMEKMTFKTVAEEQLYVIGFESSVPRKEKRRRVDVQLQNVVNGKKIKLQAMETSNIFEELPPAPVDIVKKFRDIQFADPKGDDNLPIDMLIGSDYYCMVMEDEVQRVNENMRITQSKLGWVLQGSKSGAKSSSAHTYNVRVEEERWDEEVKCFWNLESIGIQEKEEPQLTQNEEEVMRKFKEEFQLKDGRPVVALPWKESRDQMGSNRVTAERRFDSLHKKFAKDPVYEKRYKEAMEGYFAHNHVEEAKENEEGYYLPHHAVIDDDRETTKTRIVFDGSSHEAGYLPLNDVIEKGPNLNPESLATLIRFRTHKKVLAADGSKAFLQIVLKEEDRPATKFLWFETKVEDGKIVMTGQVKTYQFARVPFGLTSSPFLLAATIRTEAEKEEGSFPGIVQNIADGMYVDDFASGGDTSEELKKQYKSMKEVMGNIAIPMQKWITNDAELQKTWEESNESTRKRAKILGIGWDHVTDEFWLTTENILATIEGKPCTKRLLLHLVAKIYDPMGFATPFTFIGKVLFQDTWSRGLGWNDILPEDLAQRWSKWTKDLEKLHEVKLPRWVKTVKEGIKVEFHTFCDASQRAYGAAVYVRTEAEGEVHCELLASKSRLAPTKTVTLPRLELLAALLATRLHAYVKNEARVEVSRSVFWSDSMVTLQWLRANPAEWKPFVANRVVEIQKTTNPSDWRHCPGRCNPADHLTRGLSVEQLKTTKEWWNGPTWITEAEEKWPIEGRKAEATAEEAVLKEKKKKIVTMSIQEQKKEKLIDVEKLNDYKKVLRVTAWIQRFISNCRSKTKKKGELTAEELQKSRDRWIRYTQEDAFQEEIESLRMKTELEKNSRVKKFNPFLDKEGRLRVGGRIEFADVSYDEKHPIILDGNHAWTKLLIREEHRRLHHLGTRIVLAEIRQKYWILQGRKKVKSVILNCVTCKKLKKNPGRMIEAPLPADRLTLQTPFEVTGVDFAGPLYVTREKKKVKSYIALFTCASTRAVHLELVEDMTAERFILALRRFFSRRGVPTRMYSDNAKSFKRTETELAKIWESSQKKKIDTFLAHQAITWKYIAEKAAWWGGWWERLVQTTKRCLKKTVGRSNLQTDELETILTEIEATINSRPLTYDYTEIDEGLPLTPAHLLIGKPLTQLPEYTSEEKKEDDVTRLWKRRKQVLESFGKRWKKEYLLELRSFHQVRQGKKGPTFEVGDIALIQDEKQPQQKWQMVRILEARKGRDGRVRSCLLKTSKGTELTRPIQLLHPLEILNPAVQGGEDVTARIRGGEAAASTKQTTTRGTTPATRGQHEADDDARDDARHQRAPTWRSSSKGGYG